MKNLFLIAVFGFSLSVVNIFAQTTSPKFSSVYTDLNKSCKTIGGGGGTDPAFDCRGIGGYRIYNWFAAAAQMFAVKVPDSEKMINLATLNLDFDSRKTKVEWRMVNGKPFAVIMRVDKYSDKKSDSEIFGKKVGTELIVRGLKGFEHIEFIIDGKSPNANEAARKLADASYLKE